MNALREWTDAVCLDLNLDASDVDRDLVLDLARDVAHSVARPAAPLTAYIVGVAVGRGADGAAAMARVTALAERWARESGSAEPSAAGASDVRAASGRKSEHGDPARTTDPE